jgi:hypothetical protein
MNVEEEYRVEAREVFIVLRAHGLADEIDDMMVMDMLDLVRRKSDRIEDSAVYGDDEDEQMEFALCEIETILIESGHLSGERFFEMLEGVGA